MPVIADLLIDRIATLATVDRQGDFVVIRDAAVVARGGTIAGVGPREQLLPAIELADGAETIDAKGLSAIPGLVDCHTHAVHGGRRIDEFDRRAQGQSYQEIAAAGGGIRSTVAATRAADDPELVATAAARLRRMRALGTTTAEIKSGYGLDVETERRMLVAARRAGELAGVRTTQTVLALHAIPPEAESAEAYVELAIEQILPACAFQAQDADCFLEGGAFDVDQCRRYLEAAASLGLRLRLHGDQFSERGAIPLAVELGAVSVDHLEATGAGGVRQLAASSVIGVLLPLAALYLDDPMPPGRALLDAGASIALATDFNPGSAPCESLLTAMNLACTRMHLSCAEALTAATVGGARVLDLENEAGRLAAGFPADVVLLGDPDWRVACAHLGEVPERVLGALAPV